jgi:hypothetical protein
MLDRGVYECSAGRARKRADLERPKQWMRCHTGLVASDRDRRYARVARDRILTTPDGAPRSRTVPVLGGHADDYSTLSIKLV